MSLNISNPSADRNEKIRNAATVLGKSKDRKKVFLEIYRGKRRVKAVQEIASNADMPPKRVLEEGKKLLDEDIIGVTKKDGRTAYTKLSFYAKNKDAIVRLNIRLNNNKGKLRNFPTRDNPQINIDFVKVSVPKNIVKIQRITIDEISNFDKVKRVKIVSRGNNKAAYEKTIKDGLKKLLGEKGKFTDWGGETDDLFSTRLIIQKRRFSVAFGLKGRGTTGKLTPKKMGKNGDQINRLFNSPADVFIVQYVGQIDESVIRQMDAEALAKSVRERKKVYYGIIDGQDTLRLITAYPKYFRKKDE